MDTLKSLANTTGVKFVLIGSFDLFDLVAEHGQVARRVGAGVFAPLFAGEDAVLTRW